VPDEIIWYFFCPEFNLKEIFKMRKNEVNMTRGSKRESIFTRYKRKLIPAVAGSVMAFSLMTTTCYAASGTSAVTQPLNNLKTLVIAVIGAVGVIILAKNVMEFAQAYQQQDSSTMNSALKGIVAGIMMAGISTVLTFLGF
jgi:hypothetical protein